MPLQQARNGLNALQALTNDGNRNLMQPMLSFAEAQVEYAGQNRPLVQKLRTSVHESMRGVGESLSGLSLKKITNRRVSLDGEKVIGYTLNAALLMSGLAFTGMVGKEYVDIYMGTSTITQEQFNTINLVYMFFGLPITSASAISWIEEVNKLRKNKLSSEGNLQTTG
jgi:hypothetical protein